MNRSIGLSLIVSGLSLIPLGSAIAGTTPDLIPGAVNRGFSTSTLSPDSLGYVTVNVVNFPSSEDSVLLTSLDVAWGYSQLGSPAACTYSLCVWSSPGAMQAAPNSGDLLHASLAGTGFGQWNTGDGWTTPSGNPVEVEHADFTGMGLVLPANTNLLISVVASTPDAFDPSNGWSADNYGGPAGSVTEYLGAHRFFTGAAAQGPGYLPLSPTGTRAYAYNFTYTPVPAPAPALCLSLGALAVCRRRR